jgi:vacuolar-type H+-ATPase subunit F/Vma7
MDRVRARVAFIGDEVSALGFRLAGVDAHTPGPGEGPALFARLRCEAALILLTQEALAWVGEGALQAALAAREGGHIGNAGAVSDARACRPLVLVIPDVRGRQQPPDIGASIRRQLGMANQRDGLESPDPGAEGASGAGTRQA